MRTRQSHVIHVGDMTNKGTEALIRTDVDILKELLGGGIVNVSTTDTEGTLRLKIPCDNVYVALRYVVSRHII